MTDNVKYQKRQEYFIVFDVNGKLTARYVSGIHGDNIPKNAVNVSESLFEQTIVETDVVWTLNADGTIAKCPIVNSLDEIKALQVAFVSQAFNADLTKGFMVSLGFKMDATMDALQKLKIGYDFAVLTSSSHMTIVDYDNVAHVDLPLADVVTLLKEVGSNYQALYVKKQTLKGQVMAATTPEAVAEVVWS